MKFLLDTHLLLWIAQGCDRLDAVARELIEDPDNEVFFSAASIWEIAIKHSKRLPDFDVEPAVFRAALLKKRYVELPVTGNHGAMVSNLPPIHKDPFDRLLIAQAMLEGIIMLTVDAVIARYPGPIQRV